MIDVVTFGETMVSLRSAGPLTVPGTLTARIAGAESTVAIGLARLGHEVRWVSRVGDDAYGSVLLRTLRGERVDVSGVEVDPARPTGPHDRGRSYGGHHGCHLLPGGICCLGDQPCRHRPPRARTHPPRERDHARAQCGCGRGASGGGRVRWVQPCQSRRELPLAALVARTGRRDVAPLAAAPFARHRV